MNGTTTQAGQLLAPEPFFSPEDVRLIRDTIVGSSCSDADFASLMRVATLLRLTPLLGQIHFVKRNTWDAATKTSSERWAIQVGIHGFRNLAERTGQWDGEDEPEYEMAASGDVLVCKVRVWRKDHRRPAVGIAYFTEFAQTKSGGGLTKMWSEKPRLMIAKCAAADGYRKGFPELGMLEEEAEGARDERPAPRVGEASGLAGRTITVQAEPEPAQLAPPSALCADFMRELLAAATPAERDAVGLKIGAASAQLSDDERKALRATYGAIKKRQGDA